MTIPTSYAVIVITHQVSFPHRPQLQRRHPLRGPHSVHSNDSPSFPPGFAEWVEAHGVFVLRICYGLQLIVQRLGRPHLHLAILLCCYFLVGSQLVYHRLPWREPDAPYLLEVLYEDDDMIALNKSGGLQVLPGGLFQQRTVLTQLLWRQTQKIHHLACQKSHHVPVHRLGRGTSGILLCAKIKHAKKQLAAYFADGTSHIGDDSDTNMKLL